MVPQVTTAAINIVSAKSIGEHSIRLVFSDGSSQDVDFARFLSRSLHPNIRAFLDLNKFAGFRLEHGELVWSDYELCFPIIDLYTNQIDKLHLAAEA